MAVTLLSLPIEIILMIIESEPSWKQHDIIKSMRAICRELHAKTVHYYGQRYCKETEVTLSRDGLATLQNLSRGQLAHYVESITIDLETLLEHDCNDSFSESSEEVAQLWYRDDVSLDPDDRTFFNEFTLNSLINGEVADLLGPAIAGFSHLKELDIAQPEVEQGLSAESSKALKARCTIAAKSLLSIALARAVPLEHIVLHGLGPDIPVHISIP